MRASALNSPHAAPMLESCCVHLDRGLPSQGDPFWAYRPNRPAPLPDVVAGLLFRGCRNAAASAHYRPTSQFCSRGASLRSRPRAGISFWTMLLHDAGEPHVLTCRIPWGPYPRAGVQGRHTRKAGRPSCFDEWNPWKPLRIRAVAPLRTRSHEAGITNCAEHHPGAAPDLPPSVYRQPTVHLA